MKLFFGVGYPSQRGVGTVDINRVFDCI